MFGYSWGGFAALQAAARRPPALQAVVSVASTDDRYADDVHYMGGCLLAYYLLSWATTMHVFSVLPPDPQVVGEGWRGQWRQRLAGTSADDRAVADPPAPRRLLAARIGV